MIESLVVGLLDELCDKLDEFGIEGNVIERDSYGRPYVNIWYGKFEDPPRERPEGFTVIITDHSFYFSLNGSYEIKPPEKYSDYFKDTFMSCASRKAGFYVMSSDQIVRTIKFLFNRDKFVKKKENNMNKITEEATKELCHIIASDGYKFMLPGHVVDLVREVVKLKERGGVLMARGCGKTAFQMYQYYREALGMLDIINPDSIEIEDVIFNDPATIIIWADGTKTVVKAENEPFDPEKGLAMAISKKVLGNKYDYYDVFKKYVGRYEKKQKKGKK